MLEEQIPRVDNTEDESFIPTLLGAWRLSVCSMCKGGTVYQALLRVGRKQVGWVDICD